MSDLFLSYASADRDIARRLAQRLEREGWSVWWDRTIPPGESFDVVIEEALRTARCVVVLWSRASVASDWVKTEAAEGKARGVLVPAIIQDIEAPLAFKRIQTANLVGWPREGEAEMPQLIGAIGTILEKTPGDPERPAKEPSQPPVSAGTRFFRRLQRRWTRPALFLSAVLVVGVLIAPLMLQLTPSHAAGHIAIKSDDFSTNLQYATTEIVINQYLSEGGDAESTAKIESAADQAKELVDNGKFQDAIPILRELADKSGTPAAYNNLAVIYALAREYEQAREAYAVAESKAPDEVAIQLNKGLLAHREGRIVEAKESLAKAGELRLARKALQEIDEGLKQGLIEVEPNDKPAEGNVIPLDARVLGGIASESDGDYFSVKTPPIYRDWIAFELQNYSTVLKPRLRIYDSQKRLVLESAEYPFQVTAGQNVKRSRLAEPESIFYVQVLSLAGTGGYTLAVRPWRRFDAQEPNDNRRQAFAIEANQVYQANIMDKADLDYFKLKSGPKAELLRIELHNHSEGLKPMIVLYDGAGRQMGGTSEYSFQVTPGQDLRFSHKIAADAEYFIRVTALDSANGNYRIVVAEDETS